MGVGGKPSISRSYRQRRELLVALGLLCFCMFLITPVSASAFGLVDWDGDWSGRVGSEQIQAGNHPDAIVTVFNIDTAVDSQGAVYPDGNLRHAIAATPPGLIPNPNAVSNCANVGILLEERCPLDSMVGRIGLSFSFFGGVSEYKVPMYNMAPRPGTPGEVAFSFVGFPIYLTGSIRSDDDYGLNVSSNNISQGLPLVGVKLTFWGVPGDPSHDISRCAQPEALSGDCVGTPGDPIKGPNPWPNAKSVAYLTNPTSCTEDEGLPFDLGVVSWQQPPQEDELTFTTHAPGEPSVPVGSTRCDLVPFSPDIAVQPTTDEAETPTGLEVTLRVPQQGMSNPDGTAQSHLKDAVVTLPEGMTVNPSYANGVQSCSASQVGLISGNSPEVRFNTAPASCPDASQIGTVEVESPPLDESVRGGLYIAQQDNPAVPGVENPFDSLAALYIVAEGQGVGMKLAGDVALNPRTGQVVTTFANNPQLPFSKFILKFKGGQRAPLATPATCGTYAIKGEFTGWANPGTVVADTTTFAITKGPNGGPCPSGGTPPFKPGLRAGSINSNAGSYTPVNVQMTRNDGEQEITSFSADLPPGLVGKLAGVSYCPDAAIEAAKARSGTQENLTPSCPAASLVGNTLVGAGVGSILVSAPGKVYLAGPYKGSPISIAAITSATVGPFDLGTVVVRSAFKVDPETAKVTVDSSSSDPIPHILEGIPVHIRDIRVSIDKPEFTLNPTNCDRFTFAARLTGSGADFASPLDDQLANVSNPFQVANCAALPFKPKLSFKLKGGTKRGQFPAFQATLKARPGDANLAKTTVVLPKSEFIEQGHIRTVCTRPQFKAQQCPPGSIYGHARAITPLFDTPLEGPVYLRANGGERVLPDLVVSLKNGEIEVALAGFIDSVKGEGRVRNAFNVIPDAPVTKFTLNMLGGKRGLLVNHLDLCEVTSRADVKMVGQNGKVVQSRPKMGTSCKGKGRRGKR